MVLFFAAYFPLLNALVARLYRLLVRPAEPSLVEPIEQPVGLTGSTTT